MKEIGGALNSLYDSAITAYTPIVKELCSRKGSEKEVEWLLTWLLDYAGEERMLKLFKQVCRSYWELYPQAVAFYILEYRKLYDPKSLEGTKYEYLLHEDEINEKEWD